jgi:NitT/TauT family transport system substrate-binding protein
MAAAVEGVILTRTQKEQRAQRSGTAAALVSFVTCVSFVSAAAAISACTRQPKTGERHVRIAVGGQNQMVYLPTTLAQELGFYREEGIDAELQDFAGGAKALQALVGGSADVVSGFYDHTIQMAAEGRELVAFVAMLRFPGLVLVTSPQSAATLTTIADLKGHIAGVTTAGSSSQMLLTYMLQRNGVAADAVSVTAIGSAATAIAALEHGKVDVGMVADPAFTLIHRRNPAVRVLADLRTADGVHAALGTQAYPASVLYAKGEWIRANRETTQRLARAITRTLAWMQTHTPQEIADRTPKTFRGEDDALYVEALKASMPMFSPDGVMAAEGTEVVRTLLAGSIEKVRTATIDVSKTYTNEFIPGR